MIAIRVAAAGVEASVKAGSWYGDKVLAALGRSLEPLGGVSAAYPYPDLFRARALAEATGGEVLNPPPPGRKPPTGAAE